MRLTEVKKEIFKELKLRLPNLNLYDEEKSVNLSDEYLILSLIPRRIININPFYNEKLVTVEIKYSSKNKSNDENIQMTDMLSDIFNLNLKLSNRVFSVNRIRTEITDKILYFRFDLRFTDSKDFKQNQDDSFEKMKELNLKEE